MRALSRRRYAGIAGLTVLLAMGALAAPSAARHVPTRAEIMAMQTQDLDPQVYRDDQVITPKHAMRGMTTSEHDKMIINAAATAPSTDDPAQVGSWSYGDAFPTDFNAIHVICGPTRTCLLVAGSGTDANNFAAGTFRSFVYDPVSNTRHEVATPTDLFCSGHVLLPDGRALVLGGTKGYKPFRGLRTVYAFDFTTETYERLPDLTVGRWYPGALTMADGKVLVTAGFDENGIANKTNEVFDPATETSTSLPGIRKFNNYPRMFQTANPGEVFNADKSSVGFWNPYTNTFRAVAAPVPNRYSGNSACYVGDVRDQNLMVLGGGWPATDATSIITLSDTKPAFRAGPTLNAAKAYLSCVTLPDGSTLEANGGTSNKVTGASTEVGLLHSAADTSWTEMANLPAGEHRLYHSLLWLDDDGRVLSMTSDPTGAKNSTSLLVYEPPYLHRGVRPVIHFVPREVYYGEAIPGYATAGPGRSVVRATITSAPSATHAADLNQRYVSLDVVDGRVTLPSSSAILPPGWYRIWAVDDAGVPSTAEWIHLGARP